MKDWNYIVIERDGKKYIVDTLEYTYSYIFLHFAWILPVKAYANTILIEQLNDPKANEKIGQENAKRFMYLSPFGVLLGKVLVQFDIESKVDSITAYVIVALTIITLFFFTHIWISYKRKIDSAYIKKDTYIRTYLRCDKKNILKFIFVDVSFLFWIYCGYYLMLNISLFGFMSYFVILGIWVLTFYSQWFFLN